LTGGVVVPRPDIRDAKKFSACIRGSAFGGGRGSLRHRSRTPAFRGRLANLVNEPRFGRAPEPQLVLMIDFRDVKDKVLMGVERKSMILSEEEKRYRIPRSGARAWSPR